MKLVLILIASICLNVRTYGMFSISGNDVLPEKVSKERSEDLMSLLKILYFSLEEIYLPLANMAQGFYSKGSCSCGEAIAINNLKLKIAKDDLGNCSNFLYFEALKATSLLALQDISDSVEESIYVLQKNANIDINLKENIDKILQLTKNLREMVGGMKNIYKDFYIYSYLLPFNNVAASSEGVEVFAHDTGNVPLSQNIIVKNPINALRGDGSADVFCWPANVNINFPLPVLTAQQVARMAIDRFVIGITDGHVDFDNFRNLLQIGNATIGEVITNYVHQVLNDRSYNTEAARFLFTLKNGNFPAGILGNRLNPNYGIGVVLHLNKRVSKNIEEIHWNSLPLIPVNRDIVQIVNNAIGPLMFAPFVYNTIKRNINELWWQVGLQYPNSATIIHFKNTSQN